MSAGRPGTSGPATAGDQAPAYPVNLVLGGRSVLVVGAGPIAARKARGLVEAGAVVTVVAPEVSPAMAEVADSAGSASVLVERRPFDPADVAGRWLVVTATGDPSVDGAVHAAGEAAGVWVNAADDPAHCSFTLPAVARRGDITVAVGTGGRSPALASWLRRRAQADLGPEFEVVLSLLEEARRARQAAGTPTEGLDWHGALDSGMLDLVRAGRIAEAKERLEACLSSSSA